MGSCSLTDNGETHRGLGSWPSSSWHEPCPGHFCSQNLFPHLQKGVSVPSMQGYYEALI